MTGLEWWGNKTSAELHGLIGFKQDFTNLLFVALLADWDEWLIHGLCSTWRSTHRIYTVYASQYPKYRIWGSMDFWYTSPIMLVDCCQVSVQSDNSSTLVSTGASTIAVAWEAVTACGLILFNPESYSGLDSGEVCTCENKNIRSRARMKGEGS